MPRWRVDDGGDIAASGLDATMAAPSTAGQSRLSTSDLAAPVDDSGAPARIDRYLLLEELGHGAMGVVYAAYDPQLDRKVAIKRIRGDRGDALGHARMLREAQAMARLSHPNVVHVHDVGTTDGDVFIAMEYVHGSTLRAWLAASTRPLAAVLEIFRAAGRGLAAAHAADLVHRDFKPDSGLASQVVENTSDSRQRGWYVPSLYQAGRPVKRLDSSPVASRYVSVLAAGTSLYPPSSGSFPLGRS